MDVQGASCSDELDDWIDPSVLGPADQATCVKELGWERIDSLAARAGPKSWRTDGAAHPPDLTAPVGVSKQAAVFGARQLAGRITARGAQHALAGAGVANLATWPGVELARAEGSEVHLTAELDLSGYRPTPVALHGFNHRSFPTATMLSDSEQILGLMTGSPGTWLMACLGAAQFDHSGNINSTVIPGHWYLVGSGGGNGVATPGDVVVITLTRRRTVEQVPYVTSPGSRVVALVTDLGTFEKNHDGTLVLTAVAPGDTSVSERIAAIGERCGWDLMVARAVTELPAPEDGEIERLRR